MLFGCTWLRMGHPQMANSICLCCNILPLLGVPKISTQTGSPVDLSPLQGLLMASRSPARGEILWFLMFTSMETYGIKWH